MADWSEGYVTEIPYTYGFYRETAPLNLWLTTVLAGHRAPPLANFTYCELGSGQGFGTNLLAATNPTGQFFATDFMPAHVHHARHLSESAGLSNVHFFDKPFHEFGDVDLPPFDYIVLHGIYSWISAENQKAIRDFIAKKLKVGGLVYISYNTLPGWSDVAPVQKLLLERKRATGAQGLKAIEDGIGLVDSLRKAGFAALSGGTRIEKFVERLTTHNKSYMVHEYYNEHWNPLYFIDLARTLADIRLSFVASASISDRIEQLALKPEQRAFIDKEPDPLMKQTLRDYCLGQRFRRDVFAKGALRLNRVEGRDAILDLPFTLLTPASEVKLKGSSGGREYNLSEATYRPVVEALGEGAGTPRALAAHPAAAKKVPQNAVAEACMVLYALGVAAPCLPGQTDPTPAQSFNKQVFGRAQYGSELQYAAVPALGSGTAMPRIEQLFLLGVAQGRPPAEVAFQALQAGGEKLQADGKVLSDPQAQKAKLAEWATQFERNRLPTLRRLMVV